MVAGTSEICLELKNVGARLGGRWVLRSVDLRLREREIVSVIGPNGAGKTTLFNIVGGQLPPSAGSVFFQGREITGWPPHLVCRAGIARTFQIARPFPRMTALENVLMGVWFGKREGGKGREEERRGEAFRLLRLVGMEDKAHRLARELTLSELRRLEVARALSTRPKLLLLDEMAAGLSPQAVQEALNLILDLRERGLTLLIIDHFLNLTAQVSDRLLALDQGEKIMEGPPRAVTQHPEVVSAYLGRRYREDDEEAL